MKDVTRQVELERMAMNDPRSKGYYRLPYTFTYNGNNQVLPSGSSDDISFFLEEDHLILLSVHCPMAYIGITVYDKSTLVEMGDIFLQDSQDLEFLRETYVLRKDLFDYVPLSQAKILYNYYNEINY